MNVTRDNRFFSVNERNCVIDNSHTSPSQAPKKLTTTLSKLNQDAQHNGDLALAPRRNSAAVLGSTAAACHMTNKNSQYETPKWQSLLRDYDVICGRSIHTIRNIGNRRFDVLIRMNLQRYIDAKTRFDKAEVILSLVELFRKQIGAKFYKVVKKRSTSVGEKSTSATNASTSSSADKDVDEHSDEQPESSESQHSEDDGNTSDEEEKSGEGDEEELEEVGELQIRQKIGHALRKEEQALVAFKEEQLVRGGSPRRRSSLLGLPQIVRLAQGVQSPQSHHRNSTGNQGGNSLLRRWPPLAPPLSDPSTTPLQPKLDPYTIICSNDAVAANNIGNRRLQVSITLNLPRYLSANTPDKRMVVVEAVMNILTRDVGAKFVRLNRQSQQPEIADKEAVRQFVKEAFERITQTRSESSRGNSNITANKASQEELLTRTSSLSLGQQQQNFLQNNSLARQAILLSQLSCLPRHHTADPSNHNSSPSVNLASRKQGQDENSRNEGGNAPNKKYFLAKDKRRLACDHAFRKARGIPAADQMDTRFSDNLGNLMGDSSSTDESEEVMEEMIPDWRAVEAGKA